GGGVTANQAFRKALEQMAQRSGVDLIIPPLAWCTDNAAMAALAVEAWRAGDVANLQLDAEPVWTGRKNKQPR
ncbi:MAG TPA: hypothetical protein PKA06_06725, partial [Gemmatales bacterium]|nr:hypothetical protein [Gemmatales bacterium]